MSIATVPRPIVAASRAMAGLALLVGSALWATGADPCALWVPLLLAPVVEEALFRAGLQDGLLRAGVSPLLANLVTAASFCMAHVLLVGVTLPTLLVWLPALLIGAAYNRWRRLRVCVALHMAMNVAWVSAAQFMP